MINTLIQGVDKMPITFNNERHIYIQIVEQLQIDILSGIYKQGEKLPSVRDLAKEYQVNPNTMQRAFNELEASGLVYTERGNGRFVSGENEKILITKEQIAQERIDEFMNYMFSLDLTVEEIIKMIKRKEVSL